MAEELVAEARKLVEALRSVDDMVRTAIQFPIEGVLVDVLRRGKRDAYAEFCQDLDAALLRQRARAASLVALDGIAAWFEPAWVGMRRSNIASAQPQLGGLESIERFLPVLNSFQQFRARATRLGPDDFRIFNALHAKRHLLEALAPEYVGPVVRRTLVREALLGWKERLEREHPSLLLQREEIEQKVRRLAEIDTALRLQNRELLASEFDISLLGTNAEWEEITRLRGPRALRLREFIITRVVFLGNIFVCLINFVHSPFSNYLFA
jgi:hypothetical protein